MKPLAQNTLIQNRYLIVHLIGKGGMGEVYLAVDQRLGSAVALKRTFFAGDEMLGNAFEREARTLARMRHPVLPKVSDHFGENEEQYLVMEHISGDDLAKRLEAAQKPFPVSWVLFWADQLLDALSYLHTHEPPIIHRDIKPQNLKLTDENHIILLDFGLSKTSTGQTNISQSGSTGSVVGYTPHYAPMEQIRGIGTSARSDLYSLSATLYQLMTNTIPVDALSRADSMLNEMPDPIKPPSEINPEIPLGVSHVILKGMEVSQEKRYPDARTMQKVLRKAFNEMQQTTSAKTVAFSVGDGAVIDQPAADLASEGYKPNTPDDQEIASPVPVSIPTVENDAPIDLDATMAYDSPFNTGFVKQAEVKTEVFVAGGNSLPRPDSQSNDSPPPPAYESSARLPSDPAENFLDNDESNGSGPVIDQSEYSPNETVPFIPMGGGGTNDWSRDVGAGSHSQNTSPVWDETFSASSGKAPYFVESESEREVSPEPEAYARQETVAPAAAKKSSKKMFAVIGGLAALFLLAVVVAGGVWAYMAFAPGNMAADPTPSPSPEMSPGISPTPDTTPAVVFDSNNSNGANTGNTNTNAEHDIRTVSPTPPPTPESSSTTPTTRSAPQSVPTPARPVSTPRDKPTPKPKKTPVVRPTVLQ
ncbi:MAG: serine/threonine-protein kinase [Pyrinomonadaceae bacterium]